MDENDKMDKMIPDYNTCCAELDQPFPSSPMVDKFVTEFNNNPSEAVELTGKKMQFYNNQSYYDTMSNYTLHKDIFSYNSFDLIFKRLFAGYYKNGNINWADIKIQIAKDVNRNNGLLFNHNDTIFKEQNNIFSSSPDDKTLFNDYYKYISNQILNNVNLQNNDKIDLINICNILTAQTFYADIINDFFIPSSNLLIGQDAFDADKKNNYNLYSFLYGPQQSRIFNYDTKNNTIVCGIMKTIINLNIMAIDDNRAQYGFRIVNIMMLIDLNNQTEQLTLTYYNSFRLYTNGVYIGDILMDKNNEDEMSADGKGILYIYDYYTDIKTDTNTNTNRYPTAKISGKFNKGALKKGEKMNIVLYSSEEEFDKDAFKNGNKNNGIMHTLDNIQPGNIAIPDDINLDKVDLNYLSKLLQDYNKLASIVEVRFNKDEVEQFIENGKYLQDDDSIRKGSKKGLIMFNINTKGRQYMYYGPLRSDNKTNLIYISKKYGEIIQQINENTHAKTKNTIFIHSNQADRKDWYKFILKDDISNYSNIGEMPLQWTEVIFDSVYDNLAHRVNTPNLIPSFFSKEMLDPIGTINSTDNALFDDKNRLIKMEQVLYIEAIVYIKTFLLMFKKYKDISSLDVSQLINDISSGYQSLLEFNPDVSQKYNMEAKEKEEKEEKGETKEKEEKEETKEKEEKGEKEEGKISVAEETAKKYIRVAEEALTVTSNSVKDTVNVLDDGLQNVLDKTNENDSSLSYVNALLLPILASLNEQTGNLLAPVNIDINNKNILDTILILVKNIIIVFQMYLIVSSKLGSDVFPNAKYDPFIISQLSNNFQHLYDKINQPSNNNISIESTSKEIISKNKSAIDMLVLMLALHIGVEPTLFGGSNKKKTKRNTKKKNTKKQNTKKKNTKKKNTKKKTNKVIKMKAIRQTRKTRK